MVWCLLLQVYGFGKSEEFLGEFMKVWGRV